MIASKNLSLGLGVTAVSSGSEGAEDLQAKRREIERTLKDQTMAQAQTRWGLGVGNPGLEAALIMVGQRCGDGASLDDEMVDVSELVELESERGLLEGGGKGLQGRVNSGERSATRNFCVWGATWILTDGNIARHKSSRNALVSFLPKRTAAQMQTTDKRCSG